MDGKVDYIKSLSHFYYTFSSFLLQINRLHYMPFSTETIPHKSRFQKETEKCVTRYAR